MQRKYQYLALVAGITLVLAACSTPQASQSGDEVMFPASSENISIASLPAWTSDDELTVEVIGVGLGNSNAANDTATIVIPDPSNVVKVFVQVVTKAGTSGEGTYPDPTEVVIEAFDESDVVMGSKSLTGGTVETVGIQSQSGVSGITGLSHEAEFEGQVASVAVDLSDNTTASFPRSPRALIVSVFRDLGDGTASAGQLPNLYVYGSDGYPDASTSIALPAAFAGGDVTVTFAISDLEQFSRASDFLLNDPRIIHYSASAGGVSATATVDEPNKGPDLAIVELVLSNVPAGTTEVVADLFSPARGVENPHGDSVYWNTVSVKVTTEESGGEGCTPGYWRQEHHFDSWTTYAPSDLFSAANAFDRVITVGAGGQKTVTNPTLLQAVWATGGGVSALARHATAALLNSTSAGVDYPYSTAEVIAMVQAAIDSGDYDTTKDTLATANELGCGLN